MHTLKNVELPMLTASGVWLSGNVRLKWSGRQALIVPGNVNLYGPGNVSVLSSRCYQLMCTLVPFHDARIAAQEFVSRMGIAARKSLRPA